MTDESNEVDIIYPPPDVRAIVDKTASFVARNGKGFESRIAQNEKNNLKFGFLKSDDPYNAYYNFKVKSVQDELAAPKVVPEAKVEAEPEVEEAKEEEAQVAEQVVEAESGVEVVQKGAVANSWARFVDKDKLDMSSRPAKMEFNLPFPHGLPMMEDDIIKLTAQFTAVSGRHFLAGLAQREQRNPQFSFLKPTHVLFKYFTDLVEHYTKCLNPPKHIMEKLKGDIKSKTQVLERCVHSLEYNRAADAKRKAEVAEQQAEKVAYQSIDWHDFVVVETIEFDEADAAKPGAAEEGAGDMDMDMDMDVDEPAATPAPPPPRRPAPPSAARPAAPQVPEEEDEEIEVRTGYTPAMAPAKSGIGEFVDADGHRMSINESEKIMRYKNLDPRYREQQERARKKTENTALTDSRSIAENLKHMAAHREDIFGDEGSSSKGKQKPVSKVIWDGHTSSAQAAQQMALKAALDKQKKAAQPQRAPHSIGPAKPAFGQRPMPPPLPGQMMGMRGMPRPPMPMGMRGMPRPPMGMMGMPRPPMGMMGRRPPQGLGMPRPPMGMARPPMMPRPPPMMGSRPPMPLGARPPAMPRPPMPRGVAPPAPKPVAPKPTAPLAAKAPKRSATGLISEKNWLLDHPAAFQIGVRVPVDSSTPGWKLQGQMLKVAVNPADSIRQLKEKLVTLLGGMPRNKQQLKYLKLGFLKDSLSLAHYNLDASVVLELSAKTRGKKRR